MKNQRQEYLLQIIAEETVETATAMPCPPIGQS